MLSEKRIKRLKALGLEVPVVQGSTMETVVQGSTMKKAYHDPHCGQYQEPAKSQTITEENCQVQATWDSDSG